ncbi:lysis system i-spanin subunit Rz [Vibrio algicola]|uniref:Lysis protein n=1 Tax=Vibrio algicola TaxID=2662262 RepID=A0A5Q0TID9_9VIBR|nr:lysis system i-spanin subunit Rz [Vibrio algicola]
MLTNGYLKSIAIVLVALLCMTVFVQHVQNTNLKEKLNTAIEVAESVQHTVSSMQEQNQKMAKQYVKQQMEYENAQAKVSQLERDLADSSKRLHVNATCRKPVPAKSSSSSVDDERAPELTRDAEQSYLRLRQQITTITAQVNGLRSYIEALPSECVAK